MDVLLRRVRDAAAYRLSPKAWRQAAALSCNTAPRTWIAAQGVLSVTFDDFPSSAWRVAGPILAEHRVLATYFVSGGLEGRRVEGRDNHTAADLAGAYAAGHEIGCHGFAHENLQTLSPAALQADLDRNLAFVRDRLGQDFRFTTFAYPLGLASVAAKGALAQRFKACRGVFGGFERARLDAAYVRAAGLDRQHLDRLDLDALMAAVAQAKGWLTLYLHDVAERPTFHGCKPEHLDQALRAARRAGLAIEPFGVAAGRLRPA